MACQIHFWDAFINRQIDDVIVMNHNYEVQFRTVWRTIFNIQTKRLTDILILWPKIKLCKNADFNMKFSYGLCIINYMYECDCSLQKSKKSHVILRRRGLRAVKEFF